MFDLINDAESTLVNQEMLLADFYSFITYITWHLCQQKHIFFPAVTIYKSTSYCCILNSLLSKAAGRVFFMQVSGSVACMLCPCACVGLLQVLWFPPTV